MQRGWRMPARSAGPLGVLTPRPWRPCAFDCSFPYPLNTNREGSATEAPTTFGQRGEPKTPQNPPCLQILEDPCNSPRTSPNDSRRLQQLGGLHAPRTPIFLASEKPGFLICPHAEVFHLSGAACWANLGLTSLGNFRLGKEVDLHSKARRAQFLRVRHPAFCTRHLIHLLTGAV